VRAESAGGWEEGQRNGGTEGQRDRVTEGRTEESLLQGVYRYIHAESRSDAMHVQQCSGATTPGPGG
jgi:hypothetical protein